MLLPALVLRFWSSSPMWLDEAQSLAIASQPLSDLFEALRQDGSPPLYYLLLRLWAAAFGTSDLALRTLSGLLSVAALPVMYWAGKRIGGSARVGLIALLVLAANPWAIRYATEARMYSLLALLVLLGGWALDRTLRRPGRGRVVVLGATTGALVLTHYWAFFLLVVVFGLLALLAVVEPRARAGARRALAGLALGAVVFLPWLPSFLFQIGHTGAPWADPPGLDRLTTLPLEWAGNDAPTARWVVLLLWPLLLLGACAAGSGSAGGLGEPGSTAGTGATVAAPGTDPAPRQAAGARARVARARPAGRLLAGVALGTLLVALLVTRLTSSGVEVRYTAVVVPLVLLVVALGIAALPRRWGTAALAALVGLGLLTGLETSRLPRTQAPDIAWTLDRFAAPGDVVIYCPDQLGPAVERLSRTDDLRRITVPQGAPPTIVNWVDYARRVAETPGDSVAGEAIAQAEGGTVWLLTSPRYRTHQRLCGDLRQGLLDRGAEPRVAVPLDPDAYEYAVLERWSGGQLRRRVERVPE